MSTAQAIREGFDKFYKSKYNSSDDWSKESETSHPRRWISSMAEREKGKCLIVGCGIVDLKVLHSIKRKVVAIDISKIALREGKRLGDVVLGDVTHLPFRCQSFDFVCAFDVFEHVPKKALMLRELKTALRIGGKIFLSVPISVGKLHGDDRQPFDEPPRLIALIKLIRNGYHLTLVRGFWGRNPLSHIPYKISYFILPVFRYIPYALMGSTYISLVAVNDA